MHGADHVADADAGAGDRLRVWAPLLMALSSNSPFWNGADTGYASWRTLLWGRWPTVGSPPSVEDYERVVRAVVAGGAAMDPAMLYWQVRPALVSESRERIRSGRATPPVPESVLRAATWRAAREGMTGSLLDVEGPDPVAVPAWQLIDNLVGQAETHLSSSGDLRAVTNWLADLRERGTGAARQRRVAQRSQGGSRRWWTRSG
ncbi:glutamate-cysteine ligase family protein [Streptomyces sp. NPDC048442]|uniref:carboxylate-amine ligase n=1 Tax=Streptomyces sp. NPDC048442 TaxID=3154823 RepID=UPI00343ABE51